MGVIASYAPVNASEIGGVTVSGTPGANQQIVASSATAAAWAAALVLQAATPAAGFALQNGTPNIVSWTTPNDGQTHRALVFGNLIVATLEVGGQVNLTYTLQGGGSVHTSTWLSPGQSASTAGVNGNVVSMFTLAPNTAITVVQGTALTGGAATVWAEIWGS